MRLYADVNFNGPTIRAIRRRGVDVLGAKEDGRGQTADPELLDRASDLAPVLLTHDKDLLRETARRQAVGISFVGVVYSPQDGVPVGKLVKDLVLIAEATDDAYWQSRVEILPL